MWTVFYLFLFYSGRKVARLCGFTKAEHGRLVMLLPTTVAVQTVSQQGVTLFRLAVISITGCSITASVYTDSKHQFALRRWGFNVRSSRNCCATSENLISTLKAHTDISRWTEKQKGDSSHFLSARKLHVRLTVDHLAKDALLISLSFLLFVLTYPFPSWLVLLLKACACVCVCGAQPCRCCSSV